MISDQDISPKRTPQPSFRYYGAPSNYLGAIRAILTASLEADDSGIVSTESQLASFLEIDDTLCVSQARLGIYLALRQLLTPDKPKVIMSPYTIFDVVNMVIAAGGQPVFADVDAATWNIDYEAAAALVDDETGAILVTHLHGLACELSKFRSLCKDNDLRLVEDCAQAFGAIANGKRVGTDSDASIFSFSTKKHVNCLYGGVLVLRDATARLAVRRYLATLPKERWYKLGGRALLSLAGDVAASSMLFRNVTFPILKWRADKGGAMVSRAVAYEHNPIRRDRIPNNYLRQMTAQQATTIAKQLPNVDHQIATRIKHARTYDSMLADIDDLRLPPLREDGSHIYLYYPIQVPDARNFQRELMAHGCDVRLQSYTNLASASCFAEYAAPCPNAARVAETTVRLPMYSRLETAEVRRISSVIRALMR